MIRNLLAALLTLVIATSAMAGSGYSEYEIRVVAQDETVRAEVQSDLPALAFDLFEDLARPPGWDPAAHGPFDQVLAGSKLKAVLKSNEDQGHLFVWIEASFDFAVASEAAATQALAAAHLAAMQNRLDERAKSAIKRRLAPLVSDETYASAQARVAAIDLRTLESEHGDIHVERAAVADRFTAVLTSLAETRIDRAVAASRLEAAREAVARAAEAADLQERADSLARRTENTVENADVDREAVAAELRIVRKLLREAQRESPPMAEARQRVFELEVEVVGLEAREALLEPELEALRERIRELAVAKRRAEELESERIRQWNRAREAESQRHAIQRTLGGAVVTVVVRPTKK